MNMRVKVVFEASDEGGYTVYVPGLPGCISEGDTAEEARGNILEAIALYLEPTNDPGAPGPATAGSFVDELSI
jgi:predicted RNase H-like HicB family nuclease